MREGEASPCSRHSRTAERSGGVQQVFCGQLVQLVHRVLSEAPAGPQVDPEVRSALVGPSLVDARHAHIGAEPIEARQARLIAVSPLLRPHGVSP